MRTYRDKHLKSNYVILLHVFIISCCTCYAADEITMTVKPENMGTQLIRVSVPIPQNMLQQNKTLVASDGERQIETSLRVLTWYENDKSNNRSAPRALVSFPYKFKNDKTVLINGLGYGWVESSGLGELRNQTYQNTEQLHAFYYQLMLFHKLKADWSLLINLKPTLASDFEETLGTVDFVLQGIGIAIKQVNEKFSIGGGLAYTMRFGKPFVVPVLPLAKNMNL